MTALELARENGRQIARDRLTQLVLLSRVGRGTLYQAFAPLDAAAYLNLGIALQRLGRHDEAARHWERALRLDPSLSRAFGVPPPAR